MSIERLNYGRSWNNSEDFPRYQPDEAKVREDLQYHPDEIKNFLNGVLIPKLEQEGVEEILRTDGTTLKYVRLGEGRLLESSLDGRTWEQVKARPPAQPDWEQNDETALDYIKNRPFYEGEYEEVLLPETAVDCSGEMQMANLDVDFSLVDGETYFVDWDETRYECVAEMSEDGLDGTCIRLVFGSESIEAYGGYISIQSDTQSVVTLSITHVANGTKTISPKYLPTETWTFTLEDGTVIEKKVVVAE